MTCPRNTPTTRRTNVFALTLASALTVTLMATARPAQGQRPLRDHIDPSRLQPHTNSMTVMLQGAPRGWQRVAIERDGQGWLLRDAVSITGMVTQSSAIRFAPTLDEQSLRQEGTMGATPMKIVLDWANGRVRGESRTPSLPSGSLMIDTTVAAGIIDDNAIMPLLTGVRWTDTFDATIPVFTSGKGTIVSYRLRTVGQESVTVPAGTFDAWRVEMTGERSTTVVYITRSAPYRIVKAQLGPQFEMQLAK